MQMLSDLTTRVEQQARVRALVVHGISRGFSTSQGEALAYTEKRLGPRNPYYDLIAKAAVGAISTSDNPALSTPRQLSDAYVDRERTLSIFGQAPFRQVPLNVSLALVGSSSEAQFAGEGRPIRVASAAFDRQTLMPFKLGVISVLTDELARNSSPDAIEAVTAMLIEASASGLNAAALSETDAVPEVRPAGLLNGLSSVGSGSPASIEEDIASLITDVRSGEAQDPYFIVSRYGALFLARQRTSGGERLFPNIGIRGGDLFGIPVLITRAAESKLVLVDAPTIAVADGGADIDRATVAALELSDTPVDGPASLVSLFQANCVALRVTRYVSWTKGYTDSIAFMELGVGSPS